MEGNTSPYRDVLDTELMDCMMPRPSEVIRQFYALYEEDSQAATAYYYQLSRSSHYIRTDRVARDERWTVPTEYGDLVIPSTSPSRRRTPKHRRRPEPSPGWLSQVRPVPGERGLEREPFPSAPGQPPGLIPLKLLGEEWFLQYSPYVYYNEHCIVLNKEHTPMKVTRASMARLVDFVRQFPHYFIRLQRPTCPLWGAPF